MIENNICIVGLGLMGGSYAMALTKAGKQVTAIDKNSESIIYAEQSGIIKCGKTEDYERLLNEADAVVFALYPHAFIDFVRDNQKYFKSGVIITDVTGVKSNVVQPIQSLLREDAEFIPCHPMAGREVSGVEFADDSIFKGANFIITPTEKNTARGLDFAYSLAHLLGVQHVSELSVEQHDKMIGYVSQLTHAIAVSLMNASDNTHLAEYTGDSFRDLTRIARINEVMWSELFLMNKDILCEEIDSFCGAMQELKLCLVNSDEEGLKKLFVTSTKRRGEFNKR
ncbi:MAG: prephenate dehydrogenase [Oscillospiraceae bacterium]